MSFIVPAVLPSSRADLEKTLALFVQFPSISRIQIDVVDGRFATPASWPYSAKEEFSHMIEKGEMLPYLAEHIEYEIDLMCLDALPVARSWLMLGASRLTFHAESMIAIGRELGMVHTHFGKDVVTLGLALNIESNLSLIEPFLDHIAYLQFMGIANIGRQGQSFDRRVLEKIKIFHHTYPHIPLQVDGGVSLETAKELLALGVTDLVVGSALIRASDPFAEVVKFESLITPYGV